jgi:uncharacterized protein (DUF2336 family)
MTITYDAAKHIAKNGSYAERAQLAAEASTPPEILVFLAADTSPSVRAALATNPNLPLHAIKLLASDAEMLVRLGIARHTLNIWQLRYRDGGMNPETELARQSLELLATDQALAVREALASAIIDVGGAPQQIAQRLALDAAQSVAAPILRGYTLLDDAFLIDVLAERSESWARVAIAARTTISAGVSAAIVATGDDVATAQLLHNAGATIDDDTYDAVADRAADVPALQAPMAGRADLPKRIAVRMAEFVDEAVFGILTTRGDFDADTARDIVQVARRRLDWLAGRSVPAPVRVRDMLDAGTLIEEVILDAAAWRDEEFVMVALAVKSRIHPDQVKKILQSQNAKAVVALVWKAGLSARAATQLQKKPADIPPNKWLHPRGGDGYPLAEAEMLWQLEFYGVKIE